MYGWAHKWNEVVNSENVYCKIYKYVQWCPRSVNSWIFLQKKFYFYRLFSLSHSRTLFVINLVHPRGPTFATIAKNIYVQHYLYIAEIFLQIHRPHKTSISIKILCVEKIMACIFFLFQAILNMLLECSDVFHAFYYIFLY